MTKSYTIDRKTAAELLNVSVRTIDRYLKSGKLSSRHRRRNVYISREDVLEEMAQKGIDIDGAVDPAVRKASGSVDNKVNDVVSETEDDEYEEIPVKQEFTQPEPAVVEQQPIYVAPQDFTGARSGLEDKVADSLDFYKNLYEVTKVELDEKSEKLEKMTFRLGQLEAKVEEMVPLVEFKKQQALLEENAAGYRAAIEKEKTARVESESDLMRKIEQKERDLDRHLAKINDLKRDVYTEQKNKAVFAILTFMLLAALPIVWLALSS
jgi:excisionase family DNA binding protein